MSYPDWFVNLIFAMNFFGVSHAILTLVRMGNTPPADKKTLAQERALMTGIFKIICGNLIAVSIPYPLGYIIVPSAIYYARVTNKDD